MSSSTANSSVSKKKNNPLDGVKGKHSDDRRINLTEDSLRSRAAHRRTNSREIDNLSYDIDLDDKILDASHALRSLAIGGRRGSSGELQYQSSSERLNSSVQQQQAQTVESGVGSAATPSTSDTEADVVTSTQKKKNVADATTKIKAMVFSGGFLVDRGTGKEYLGGETRIVSLMRNWTFEEMKTKIVEEEEPTKRSNVQIMYPDGDHVISVKNDDDVETMMEEWEAVHAVDSRKKLKIYVVEKATNMYGSNNRMAVEVDASRKENSYKQQKEGEQQVTEQNINATTTTTTTPFEDASNGAVDETQMRNGSPSLSIEPSKSPRSHGGLQIIPRSDLTLGARLGGGAFGEVYAAVWRGAEVAVKFINREFVFSPPGSPKRHSLDNIFEEEEFISNSNSDDDDDDDDDHDRDADDDFKDDDSTRRRNNARKNMNDIDNMHREQKRKEKEEQHEQFLREAETLASLSHPNVVSIFGVVTDGDRPGIVEEFLSGGSLQRVLAKERERAKDREVARQDAVKKANGDVALEAELLAKVAASTATRPRLDAKTRLQLCLDVARGMEYLHAKRFVHFDLKSDNVLAAVRGRRLVCKVCDFGLSKRRRSQASFVSGVNSRRGTLPWTAPEVLRSPDKVTESADVYSFAIVMWELWTSQLPHYGLDEYALYGGLMMHQLRPPIPGDDTLSPRTGPYRAATKDAQVTVDVDPPCEGWEALMKNCWKENSKERPKFVDIVASLEFMKSEHFDDANGGVGTPPVNNKPPPSSRGGVVVQK